MESFGFPTASINRNYTFKKGNYEIFIIVSFFSLFCTVNMYSNEKSGLTLIPPGKISNKINLDIRGGIVNRVILTKLIKFPFWDKEKIYFIVLHNFENIIK